MIPFSSSPPNDICLLFHVKTPSCPYDWRARGGNNNKKKNKKKKDKSKNNTEPIQLYVFEN
jgi:hypothetical protein